MIAAIRSAGRNASVSRERGRARNTLVIAQVAMAVVLLISAGLMIRTFLALRHVEAGFTGAAQLQTARISIPGSLVREPDRVLRTQQDIMDSLRAIPGVQSVAFTSEIPMVKDGHNWDVLCAEGMAIQGSEIPPLRIFKNISPGLFQTMGTRLIAGRDLTWADIQQRRHVVLLSENLAREFWNDGRAAVGKRISSCLPKASPFEVIGVVQDVYDNGVDKPAPAIVYWPAITDGVYSPGSVDVTRGVAFLIRTANAGSEGLAKQVSQSVWAVNANIPLASVRTMQEVEDESMARTSFALVMLGIASAMALALGIIGIYGVIAYAVTQRRREMGIRLALGAQPGTLHRMFVQQSLWLAAIGVGIGLLAAAGLMRMMGSLLFGISPLDPLTYASVPLVLLAAAMVASYLPARRVANVDPSETLRAEG